MYDTKVLSSEKEDLEIAAKLLLDGEVVGIPTETVYGLAANALSSGAVGKIFKAKGRPSDNPLIVHLSKFSDTEKYAKDIPDLAYKLAEKFCPGALTMILPKREIIPSVVSGGLSTVGIRVPLHETARELIEIAGVPLAAPSANISGLPSPTAFEHVFSDMNGKISAIINGGNSSVGVESTVVCFEGDSVRILRPGFVTAEDISREIGCEVFCDKGVLNEVAADEVVASPGMKYKHYSPKADVTIVSGEFEKFVEFMSAHNGEKVYAVVFEDDLSKYPYKAFSFGNSPEEQAALLFSVLREADEIGVEKLYVRSPEKSGVGLAVYNRLLRSAGFEVISV